MKHTKKGFTLIELLVVIAIIGILASVVLASLNSARAKSRDARRIADVKQIQLALELYADSHSQVYPQESTWVADLEGATCAGSGACISKVPVPPAGVSGFTAYAYNAADSTAAACTTACVKYHIGAALEEATNQALTGDAGKGPIRSGGFEGESVACSTTSGTDQCYDVVN